MLQPPPWGGRGTRAEVTDRDPPAPKRWVRKMRIGTPSLPSVHTLARRRHRGGTVVIGPAIPRFIPFPRAREAVNTEPARGPGNGDGGVPLHPHWDPSGLAAGE